MINVKIEKTNLLYEELSKDTLRLARAIYNTHVGDNYYLDLEIKFKNICSLLNLQPTNESINYIKTLFIELNEPICVKNFTYKNKTFPMRFVIFCTYTFTNDSVKLELSEEYLEVEANYMLDSFLIK